MIGMRNASTVGTCQRRTDHTSDRTHNGIQNCLRIKALMHQRCERRRGGERVGVDYSEVRHGVDIGTNVSDLEPRIDRFSTLLVSVRPENRARQSASLTVVLRAEGCQSGRMGRSRKPLRRSASPWVQIPPLPPSDSGRPHGRSDHVFVKSATLREATANSECQPLARRARAGSCPRSPGSTDSRRIRCVDLP